MPAPTAENHTTQIGFSPPKKLALSGSRPLHRDPPKALTTCYSIHLLPFDSPFDSNTGSISMAVDILRDACAPFRFLRCIHSVCVKLQMDQISSWGRNIVPGDRREPPYLIKYHANLAVYLIFPPSKLLARIWYIFLLNLILNQVKQFPHREEETAGSAD